MFLPKNAADAQKDLDRQAKEDLLRGYGGTPPAIRTWLRSEEVPVAAARSYLETLGGAWKDSADAPWESDNAPRFPDAARAGGASADDRALMARAMGVHAHAVRMPERKDDGTFVLYTVRPSDLRAALADGRGLATQAYFGAPRLVGEELEVVDRAMGMTSARPPRMPERRNDGTFVVHTVRPSDLRAQEARRGLPTRFGR
jgi:hypothetical protein